PEWTPPAPVTPGLDPTHRAVNPLWTLLRVDQRGRGADCAYWRAGAFSVFAVHGTAVAPENELLDAGIHGIVERGLERHVDSLSRRGAAYHLVANGAEGDVSPDWPVQSRCGAPALRPVVGPGGPRTPPAPWEWRDPAPAWMGLCRAAARPNPHDCQGEKRVALGGLQRKFVVGEHGLPEVAQLSVIRLGDLLLGVVPAEVTTRAGALMERAIAESAGAAGLEPRAVTIV